MTAQQKLLKNKLGFLEFASFLGNVSEACRVKGYSRDIVYRTKNANDEGGMDALMENSRPKPYIRNRVEPAVEATVLDLALEYPSLGQKRVSSGLVPGLAMLCRMPRGRGFLNGEAHDAAHGRPNTE